MSSQSIIWGFFGLIAAGLLYQWFFGSGPGTRSVLRMARQHERGVRPQQSDEFRCGFRTLRPKGLVTSVGASTCVVTAEEIRVEGLMPGALVFHRRDSAISLSQSYSGIRLVSPDLELQLWPLSSTALEQSLMRRGWLEPGGPSS